MREIKSMAKEVTERLGKPAYYVVEVGYTEYVFEELELASDFAMGAFIHSTEDVRITLTRDMDIANV